MCKECNFLDEEGVCHCTWSPVDACSETICENNETCIFKEQLAYIEELKEALEEVESNLENAENEIGSLESEVEELEGDVSRLESELSKLEDEFYDGSDIAYYIDELYTDICLNHITPHKRNLEEVAYDLWKMSRE